MNLLRPSELRTQAHRAQVQLRSNWIDILAIPLLTSVMVAQPVYIIMLYISATATGGSVEVPFLNEFTIILLALGLRWWALGVQAYAGRGSSVHNESLLRVLGLLLAGGLVIGTPLLLTRSVFSIIVVSVLIIWLWWRSMRLYILDSDIQLLNSFRLGFFALVILLVLTVLYNDGSLGMMFAQFTQGIPIFFLSGLLAISFNRISLIRSDYARYGSNSVNGSTRNWLVILTICWILVVVAAFIFESISFQFFIAMVSLLWSGVVAVLTWLVFLLDYILTPVAYLFSSFFWLLVSLLGMQTIHTIPTIPKNTSAAPQQQIPPEILSAMRFLVLFVLLLLFYSIVRSLLHLLPKKREENDVEEIREGLSLSSLTDRNKEKKAQSTPVVAPLEALDPESARAYYRELLQTVAETNPAFSRRPDETPNEYQERLLTAARSGTIYQATGTDTVHHVNAGGGTRPETDMPSNEELVRTLTLDYSEERYGGEHLDETHRNYLHTWMPRLIARLLHQEQ